MMESRRNSTASIAKRRRNGAGKVSHLLTNYSGPSFSDLPSNITVTILLRLSVKRIFVCKCVCKTWYDLISNPDFAKLHFDQAEVYPLLRTSGFTVLSRMIYLMQPEHDDFERQPETYYYPKLKIRLDTKLRLPLGNLQMINPDNELVKNNYMKLNMRNHKYRIVNSCNGLLCLSNPLNNDPVIVCNPITGEFINLPEFRTVKDSGKIDIACGFGFSPVTKQYKVIRMFTRRTGNSNVMVAEVNIVGTDSWKDLQFFPASIYKLFPTYLNGCLYWFSPFNPYCVICFDIEKECFESISLPPFDNAFRDKLMSMGVLGGELFLSVHRLFLSVHRFGVTFWALKDHGTEKTWTEMFTLDENDNKRWPHGSYQPIKYMNDGALLMFNSHKRALIYKHPKKSGFRYWKVHGFESKVEAIAHNPSFVSLRHALSGHNATVLNIKSRCAELKLYKETKGIFIVEKR